MAVPGSVVDVHVGAPYFTKYSEDHWTPNQDTPVMFQDQHYPSATAALDAYISQHEGRLVPLSPGRGGFEDVEDLLIHKPLPSKLDSLPSRAGLMDNLNSQRLRALKQMVDEAYARIESTSNRPSDDLRLISQGKANLNSVFAESQKLLTQMAIDRVSPLPGSSSGITGDIQTTSITTEALLNSQLPATLPSRYQTLEGSPPGGRGSSFKTMQDYVEEARRVGNLSPDSHLLNQLQASLQRMGSSQGNAATQYSQLLTGLNGDNNEKTLNANHLGIASPKGVRHPPRQTHGGGSGGGSGRVPSWVDELGTSTLTSPSSLSPKDNDAGTSGRLNMTDLGHHPLRHSKYSYDDSALLDTKVRDKLFTTRNTSPKSARLKTVAADRGDGSDRFSMTTDDLIYASPDGRTMKSKVSRSHKQPYSSHMSPIGEQASAKDSVSIPTDTLLLHSPSGRLGYSNKSRQPPGPDYQVKPGHDSKDTHQRREFITKLFEEVEESPSSIITGYLQDGALNPYQSPLTGRGRKKDQGIPTPIKLKTLGLLTPETERLLSNPPMPAAMPGYVPSPILPPASSDPSLHVINHVTPHGDQDDFTERVRALLLGAPPGEFMHDSIGGAGDSPKTEEILDGDRDWERQVPVKPTQPLSEEKEVYRSLKDQSGKTNIVDSFLKDCLDESHKDAIQRLTGIEQPGSMEALKNMLFKVQGLVSVTQENEQLNSRSTIASVNSPAGCSSKRQEDKDVCPTGLLQNDITKEDQNKNLRAGKEAESFDSQPGADCLHKAMVHLNRLKDLVKDKK